MGIINVKIDDKDENDFRMKLLIRKGSKKGAMGESVGEALRNWIYSKEIWVQDIPKEKAERFKQLSESIYPKLEYFPKKPLKTEDEEYVGMYYRLRLGEEP